MIGSLRAIWPGGGYLWMIGAAIIVFLLGYKSVK